MDNVEIAGTVAAYAVLGMLVGFGVLFPMFEVIKILIIGS